MTSAVIATKTPDNVYQYWVVDHHGNPDELIPAMAFLNRYGRWNLHLKKFSRWQTITPAVTRADNPNAILGFGIPRPEATLPTFVTSLDELDGLAEHLYVVDAENPDVVVHDGTAYDMMRSSTWENRSVRRAYTSMAHVYGY